MFSVNKTKEIILFDSLDLKTNSSKNNLMNGYIRKNRKCQQFNEIRCFYNSYFSK